MTCSFWSPQCHHSLLLFLPDYLPPISCVWHEVIVWHFFHTEPCAISCWCSPHAAGCKLYPHNAPRKGGGIRYFHSPSSFRSLIDFSIVHFHHMFLSWVALHSLHLPENKLCVRCWDLLLDPSQFRSCECHLKNRYDIAEEVCEGVTLSRNHHPSKPAVSCEGHTTVYNREIIAPKKQVPRGSRQQVTQHNSVQPRPVLHVSQDVSGHWGQLATGLHLV